jgi:hypothetical protein
MDSDYVFSIKFHTSANKWWEHFSYIINIFTSSVFQAWNLCCLRFVRPYILFIIWITTENAIKEDFNNMVVIHKNVDNFKLLLCPNHILGHHHLLCIHFRQFIVNLSTITIMHLTFLLPLSNPTNPIHNSSCRLRLPYIWLWSNSKAW